MNRFRFRMMVCILPVLMLGVRTAVRGDDKAVGKRPIRASQTLGAQRYAVIIGINDYHDKQIPDLTFAEGDARAVYDVLTDPAVGGIKKENATLLVGKTATTRNIRKALAELRTIPKDATVFIFFSGHGAKESDDAFWVTYDSELGGLAFSAMPDREIRAMTGRIPSNRLIMLLDCCYAAATVKENKSVVDMGDILKKFVGKGRVTITASGSGEEAIEAHDLKRGVFTYYLLKALRGAADGTSGAADGIVTVPELTAYIDKTVAEAARRRKGIQKPAIFMEEVQDPAKFLVTIDPAKMASLAEAARRQTEQVKARLGILKRLFIDEKLTAEQYRLGKDLFGRDPAALSKQDRERVGIFVDLVESTIPARRLGALLDSVESPAQRMARLERERVAAEVKTTLVKLRRAFDRKDASRAYKLFEALKRLSPDDPQVADWSQRLAALQPPTLRLDLGGGVAMELVRIEPGSFRMGSPESEEKRDDDEGPRHRVRIGQAFYLGKYEVTNAQFRRFRPDRDSGEYNGLSLNGDAQPACEVSWEDAKAFCAWLRRKSGKPVRLPSAAEWEYACRAGTQTRYSWGDGESSANRYCNGNDPVTKRKFDWSWDAFPNDDGYRVSANVGSFSPNAWGLYDMHGNVWEWCEDVWHDNYNGAPDDGTAWTRGGDQDRRVLRGGSWDHNPGYCRSALRLRHSPGSRYGIIGLRIASGTP